MKKLFDFIMSFILVAATYVISKLVMGDGYHQEWYQLFKPSFAPHHHIYKFIWPVLYMLFAYVLYAVYSADNRTLNGKTRKKLLTYLMVDLVGKVAWGFVFFRLELPLYAFIISITMNIMNILIFKHLYHSMRNVALVFLPYLIWLMFAAVMNGTFIYNFVILTLKALES